MRIPATVAAAAVLLVLAGCTSGVTPVPQVSIPGLLGDGSTATPGSLASADVCAAFPVRAVAKASGWRLTTSAPTASIVGTAAASECRYAGADGAIRLLVVPGGGDVALTTLIGSPELGGGTIVVTGLGDAAQAALDGIVVRYGQDVVAVIEQPRGAALRLAKTQDIAVALHDRLAR